MDCPRCKKVMQLASEIRDQETGNPVAQRYICYHDTVVFHLNVHYGDKTRKVFIPSEGKLGETI